LRVARLTINKKPDNGRIVLGEEFEFRIRVSKARFLALETGPDTALSCSFLVLL
jgi:hypothetical protein